MKTNAEKQIADMLLTAVKQELASTELEVRLTDVIKNNNVERTAVAVRLDGVEANRYIDHDVELILNGQATLNEVASSIARGLKVQAEHPMFTASGVLGMFDSPDLSRLQVKVINKESNKEMLKMVPHRDIAGDLTVVPMYKLNDEGVCVINKSICSEHMHLTVSELMNKSIERTCNEGAKIRTMLETMAGIMGVPEEDLARTMGVDNEKMLVVTNHDNRYGATNIFIDKNVREQVAERFGGDFYIIPSSIHEVICVSADSMSPQQLATMIGEVNATEVSADEVLSNHPYFVDGQSLKISNPCTEQREIVADEMRHSLHM